MSTNMEGPPLLAAMLELKYRPLDPSPMTYILRIGPWHVGPFDTHIGAQTWAERHGCDDFTLIPLDHPAEAPIRIHRLRMAPLKHPMRE